MINAMVAAAMLVAQAAPAPPVCLTREEVGDMAITLAPRLFGAVADRCRAHVGPGAFLNSGWEAYRMRLEAEAGPRRDSAMRAFDKMSAGGPPLDGAQQGAAMEMMSAMLTVGIGAGLPTETCGDVDRMLGALAPLPVANLGVLISSSFALARVGQNRPPAQAPGAPDRQAGPAGAGDDDHDHDAEGSPAGARPGGPPTICPA